jgi:hypothetical protein
MLFVFLLCAILAILDLEKRALNSLRARLPLRVHIFGTRGKSGAVLALADALRARGLCVYGRTTGDKPLALLPDGNTRPFRRFGPPRVQEYVRVIREAGRHKADVLVLECMALSPETIVVADELLAPDIVALTNTRPDHQESMGGTPGAIADTLALCVGKGQDIYAIADAGFERIRWRAEEKGSRLHRLEDDFSAPGAAARHLAQKMVLDIAERTGCMGRAESAPISAAENSAWPVFHSVPGAAPDAGSLDFLDLFSVNDLVSSQLLLLNALEQTEKSHRPPLVAFLATRADRPLRTKAFVEWLAKEPLFDLVAVQGSHAWYGYLALKRLKTPGLLFLPNPFMPPERLLTLLQNKIGGPLALIGLGNARGPGESLRAFFSRKPMESGP